MKYTKFVQKYVRSIFCEMIMNLLCKTYEYFMHFAFIGLVPDSTYRIFFYVNHMKIICKTPVKHLNALYLHQNYFFYASIKLFCIPAKVLLWYK